ncbi:hypothetical protein LIPSTDRAFT_331818 [Lipomyces starkeyi NRRL Y-11557]|uniref:BED-type domain-containing protein n=1 Tax=Lipomyces starkeyi NRRL Y-11557 TaxID=675824 RepID=A0A1E3Q2K6_LIPST|nr:hypothetical protein LIPSTDRAFT_331818 [Lipomyces starkeyi NRRL Y-11557]
MVVPPFRLIAQIDLTSLSRNMAVTMKQRRKNPLASTSQYRESTEDGPYYTSSLCESEPSGKRTQNQVLWAQFTVSLHPGKMWWPKRGKGPVEDRQIQCNLYNWKTTNSSRATSTSNMIAHLAKHGIFPNDYHSDREVAQTRRKRTITEHASWSKI